MYSALALVSGLLALISPSLAGAQSSVASSSCPTPSAAARANAALRLAEGRYGEEAGGSVIHANLREVAHDRTLLSALSAGNLGVARAEANRQLTRHIVRIRVVKGSRLLVDANSTSFDVAGSAAEIFGRGHRDLGLLEITIQDVIGFIKLVHKYDHSAEVVVRGARGQVRSSLSAATRLSLPASGCRTIGTRPYVVRSFARKSFTDELLTIWLLTAA